MTEIIITRPEFLAAASLFVSKDGLRYYLNGVLIEPDPRGGIFLVATDGHRLVVFRDPDGMTDKPHILPVPKHLFDACKYSAKAGKRELMADGDLIHLYENIVEEEPSVRVHVSIFSEIDGTYPDWKAIIPGSTIEQQQSDSFSCPYLSSFGQLIIAAYGNSQEHKAIRLLQNGQGGALVLHNTIDWFGMLMPMRLNIDRVSLPFFVESAKPGESQVAAE
ncbi:hypothetical protein [Cohaesibacter haloalkalitolerans]|uniref:hypothetical protein n=1 Tax=Cohaesibacter haloalkalitolerans TaxID=1162980 RepID=UPI000E65C6A2|nr:hypothetical protein [Cohaesibacter haloalkalitolerans]